MKKFFTFVAISSAILDFAACTSEIEETPVSFTKELTFTATQEGLSPETKTMRIEDGSTWWQPAEEISVFYGNGSNGGSKFTSKNNTLQETVEFEGSITISGSGKDFWAVYPYSTDNACDGNSITTVIPAYQMGSEGNFSGDAFPTIAKSNTLDLAFWNICGGIKFFVSRNDIVSITFKGNNGETLAGKVKVAFNDSGVPTVTEVLDGKSEVTLAIPDGTPFKAGKYYYLTLLPGALESGFTMTFTSATEQGTIVSNNAQTVKRSIFGVLKNIDAKVSEWESTWVEPEWVDLGLSVKWATFNVGASKPEDYGDYFAWGETEPKDDYSFETYKWCNGSLETLNKYNYSSSSGTVDNKTILERGDNEGETIDDVARANWGGSWRMPTDAELTELKNNCTWTWTDNYNGKGVAGMIVTSNVSAFMDKSIFLPAAGWWVDTTYTGAGGVGFYWSSSLSSDYPFFAESVLFSLNYVSLERNDRKGGFTIRPVYDDRIITDLSENETANCYIIPDSGYYKFKAVKGNSNEAVTATKVDVLWETWNDPETTFTAGRLVRFVIINNGYVEVSIAEPFHAGNALIAARDANDNIIWSWHLWLPETPVTSVPDPEKVFYKTEVLDRNLGALIVQPETTGEDPTRAAYGLYYQWGRKDPFTGRYAVAGMGMVEDMPGTLTTDASIANPTTLANGANNNNNWNAENIPTLWDNDGKKTIYDPCPPGYKVPVFLTDYGMWQTSSSGLYDENWTFDDNRMWFKYNATGIIFPTCGYLLGSTRPIREGIRAFLWSANPGFGDQEEPRGSTSFFDLSRDNGKAYYLSYFKYAAGTVRCAKVEVGTNLWSETGTIFYSNVTWTAGSDAAYDQTAFVNGSEEISILKLGTSAKYGKSTLTLPAGSTKLSFYAVSWNNTAIADLVFTVNDTQVATVTPKANSDLKGNPPYTITVNDDDCYTIDLGGQTTSVTVETSGEGCRAALFRIVAE